MEHDTYKETADRYDRQVREYDSYGHDVLFGMAFEFSAAGQNLLDIGIGTGLASQPFAKLGLKVYGLDISEDMLAACRSKGFAEDLKPFDISSDRIPYPDAFFHQVVCCGTLHFLGDLTHVFNEIHRVLKNRGVVSFSFAPGNSETDYAAEPTAWGVPVYRHSPDYIRRVLHDIGLSVEKEQRLLIKGADKATYNMEFAALVAR